MKRSKDFPPLRVIMLAVLAVWAVSAPAQSARTAVTLYSTGFEYAEGFDPDYTLVGQNGWVGYGSGGNGMVTNSFQGLGQQAFIGFAPPDDTNDFLNVWRPVKFSPGTNQTGLLQFTVDMAIVDSTNTNRDDFRWSVYNDQGDRLFSLDFDNFDLLISYSLDDGRGFVSTGSLFTNSTLYRLTINMDMVSNAWNAVLDDHVLVTSQPVTTKGAPLNLGDIDAVWAIRDNAAPGDNHLVFDNYRIVANPQLFRPAVLEPVTRLPQGQFLLRITGEPGHSYQLEVSPDFLGWEAIKTFTFPSDGVYDFLDTAAVGASTRYYRARLVGL